MLIADDYAEAMAAVTAQVDELLDSYAIDLDRRLLKCRLTAAELEQWRIELVAGLFVVRHEVLEKLSRYLLRVDVH